MRTTCAVEGVAFQQLHRDERLLLAVLVLHLLDRVNSANVGMVQRRSGARLKQKAVECILIPGKLRRQKLQRHPPSQIKVLCLVNNSHPAAAKLAGDAVMRDGLADHGIVKRKLILGGMRKAVKPKRGLTL